ncbi:MAG: hypothetical protein GY765_23525 [bacterium]|nr:hypothetical protein [bacterium]
MKRIFQFTFVVLICACFTFPAYSQIWHSVTKKEKPTFKETRDAVHKYWAGRKDKKKPGFKQYKRWEWFAQNRLNQKGRLEPGNNLRGWLEKNDRFGTTPTGNSAWTPLGPFDVPGAGLSRGGLGRLNCIAFHPGNTNIIWVGAPTGGLWKSEDGGTTWNTNTDNLPNLGVSDIAIHPTNPQIMYIACGDRERGSTLSFGIMKSIDGGNTWNLTGLNPEVTEQYKICKLIMLPGTPDTLLAASNKGIYKTINGGETWTRKTTGDFVDMTISPAPIQGNGNSTWFATKAADGVFRSSDSGETWTRLNNGLPQPSPGIGRIKVAIAPNSPSVMYAVYCEDIQSVGWEWGLYGVYRSTDGGDNWALQADSPNMMGWSTDGTDRGGQAGFAFVLAVNPENHNELYTGSVYLWKSSDGGVTWDCITGNNAVHVDHHELAFSPGSTTTIFSCNDGGIFRSTDNGYTWDDLSDGLAIQQIYRLGLSAMDSGMIVAGVQDNGSEVLDGNWIAVNGGDGADCMIDPNDSSIVYCTSQFGRLVKLSNRGRGNARNIFSEQGAAWIAPFAFDPGNSTTLYAATRQVFKSTNGGTSWNTISPELSADSVTTMKIASSDPNYIYVSDGTRIFKTSNGGTDWLTLHSFPSPTFITDICIHKENPRQIWVSIGGYGRWNSKFTWDYINYETDKPKVFLSKDGGNTWNDISGNLPNIPVNCMVQDAYGTGIYLGTDLGVFLSPTGEGQWERFDNGLPNVIVTDMEVHKATARLVVSTYGRGLWESPTANPPAIYPPKYLTGSAGVNRSLLQSESVHVLNWEANPKNTQADITVLGYRVYRASQGTRTLLMEVNADTFQYVYKTRTIEPAQYALTTVGEGSTESEPIHLLLGN